jgi:uncharacterized protein YuzE
LGEVRIDYDRDADAAYVWLRLGLQYAYGEDLDSSRRIDYGLDGQPIGVELLNVSQGVNLADLPERQEIARLLQEQAIQARLSA